MMKIDTHSAKRFERALRDVNASGYDFASVDALNGMAFEGRRFWREIQDRKFTIRNKYLKATTRVQKARLRRPYSVLGSMAEEMSWQEFGKTMRKASIATPYAGGSGRGMVRTRAVMKPRRMTNIELRGRKPRAKSAKQRNVVAIAQAKSSGNPFAYLDGPGIREGIYRVLNARIHLVHDLSIDRITIPRTPTLMPATRKVMKRGQRHWNKGLARQLQRIKRRNGF